MRRRNAIFAIAAMLLPMTVLPNQSAVADHAAPAVDVPADSIGSIIGFIRAHPTEYSGIYLDRASDRYVIGVPAGNDGSVALAKVTSNLDTAGLSERRVVLTTTQQKRSLADLMTIHAHISAQHGDFGAMAGDDLSQWGLDEERNAVQVGVLRLDDALVATAQRTYGDSVYLLKVDRHYTAVRQDLLADVRTPADYGPLFDRQLDSRPYWAGDQIGWINNNRIFRCTSGWMSGIRRGQFIGPEFMWTAGHCFPLNAVLEQGNCQIVDNSCAWTSTGVMGTVNDVEWGDNRMDWESVNPPTVDTVEQRVYVLGPTSAASVAEFSFVGAALNQPICTEGAFTGENCTGMVTSTNGCTRLFDEASNRTFLVCNQTFAASTNRTRLVNHGDSGGPVLGFSNGSREPGTGVGIISGGNVGTSTNPGPGTTVNFTDGAAICNRTRGC